MLKSVLSFLLFFSISLCATTTPFPAGVKPYRDPLDAGKYNAAAKKIMKEQGVLVNDLYSAIEPSLAELQKPKNVHFKGAGSNFLAELVVNKIKEQLKE